MRGSWNEISSSSSKPSLIKDEGVLLRESKFTRETENSSKLSSLKTLSFPN
jgi:hypothetical protein